MEKVLAKITSTIGVVLLRREKRLFSEIIESANIGFDNKVIIKNLIKNRLHDTYESIKDNIKQFADDIDLFEKELFRLEEENKKY